MLILLCHDSTSAYISSLQFLNQVQHDCAQVALFFSALHPQSALGELGGVHSDLGVRTPLALLSLSQLCCQDLVDESTSVTPLAQLPDVRQAQAHALALWRVCLRTGCCSPAWVVTAVLQLRGALVQGIGKISWLFSHVYVLVKHYSFHPFTSRQAR
jgi:hypothetical protein